MALSPDRRQLVTGALALVATAGHGSAASPSPAGGTPAASRSYVLLGRFLSSRRRSSSTREARTTSKTQTVEHPEGGDS